jgi:hypothetical protein
MTTFSDKDSFAIRILQLADSRIKGMVADRHEEVGKDIADVGNRNWVTGCVMSSRVIWNVIKEIGAKYE